MRKEAESEADIIIMLTAASASVRLASPGDLRLLLLRPQRPVPADLRALDQAQPRTLRLGAGLQHHRQVATDTPPGYTGSFSKDFFSQGAVK